MISQNIKTRQEFALSTTTPVQEHYDTSSVFVAVIGRPNVGKSSLTNLLVGEKVALSLIHI